MTLLGSLALGLVLSLLATAKPHRVIVHNPPGHWRPVDTLMVVDRPRAPARDVTMRGKLKILGLPADGAQPDSFRVWLPGRERILFSIFAGGAELPLKARREPGDGLAWKAFYGMADTMLFRGWDNGDRWQGNMELRTAVRVRPDSNATYAGFWDCDPPQPYRPKARDLNQARRGMAKKDGR